MRRNTSRRSQRCISRGDPDGLRFCENEKKVIVEAITAHRDADAAKGYDLAGILYRADKNSRNCFACKAEHECNWSREKKNTRIKD